MKQQHFFIFTRFSNDQLSVAQQELKIIIPLEDNNKVCISYQVSQKVVYNCMVMYRFTIW